MDPTTATGPDTVAIFNVVAAAGAAIAAWGAAWAAVRQAHAARAQNSLTFVTSMAIEWISPRRRQQRGEAAGALLAGNGEQSLAVHQVLSWFEGIGMLLERQALDAVVVWNLLSTPILYYRAACRRMIEAAQRNNPAAWESFVILAREMERIERRRGGSDHTLSTDEMREFLETEVANAELLGPERPQGHAEATATA